MSFCFERFLASLDSANEHAQRTHKIYLTGDLLRPTMGALDHFRYGDCLNYAHFSAPDFEGCESDFPNNDQLHRNTKH
jgi:hypothetical protein